MDGAPLPRVVDIRGHCARRAAGGGCGTRGDRPGKEQPDRQTRELVRRPTVLDVLNGPDEPVRRGDQDHDRHGQQQHQSGVEVALAPSGEHRPRRHHPSPEGRGPPDRDEDRQDEQQGGERPGGRAPWPDLRRRRGPPWRPGLRRQPLPWPPSAIRAPCGVGQGPCSPAVPVRWQPTRAVRRAVGRTSSPRPHRAPPGHASPRRTRRRPRGRPGPCRRRSRPNVGRSPDPRTRSRGRSRRGDAPPVGWPRTKRARRRSGPGPPGGRRTASLDVMHRSSATSGPADPMRGGPSPSASSGPQPRNGHPRPRAVVPRRLSSSRARTGRPSTVATPYSPRAGCLDALFRAIPMSLKRRNPAGSARRPTRHARGPSRIGEPHRGHPRTERPLQGLAVVDRDEHLRGHRPISGRRDREPIQGPGREPCQDPIRQPQGSIGTQGRWTGPRRRQRSSRAGGAAQREDHRGRERS